MTAAELVSKFTPRLRGPAHTHEMVRLILSHCQRLVNARLRTVLTETPLTLRPLQALYTLASDVPEAFHVETVRFEGRDLNRVAWQTLAHANYAWFREVGTQPETFSQLGHGLLVIHPALEADSSVTIIATKLTAPLADDTTPVELPDEALPHVMDLAEAVLMLRERRLDAVAPVLSRLAARMRLPDVTQQRSQSSQ